MADFGPHLYGYPVIINECPTIVLGPVCIDIETDEKDNFVGMACFDGRELHYYTDLKKAVEQNCLDISPLIGHNLKGDMKWLIKWGVDIKPSQLYYDTILASYVQNTTKESHGLKTLAKEYLGLEWPTYKEMVGKGRAKVTLDKQEVERVAAYCGMDCLATYRLYEYFNKKLTEQEKKYLQDIELPTARVLLEMELKGAKVDTAYLSELNEKFLFEIDQLENRINDEWMKLSKEEPINVNSNRQVAELLEANGATLPKTRKGNKKVDKETLNAFRATIPVVSLLLEHSKLEKLQSTYTQALLDKNIDGRIYGAFNQVSKNVKGDSFGIATGRLSSSNPNLQNIPTRTEEGKEIRQSFIASSGMTLIDADYSQIEPRLVAHFSNDALFIRSFVEDKDIYEELVEGTGRDRQDGKTFMLALLYGARPRKLASVFRCSEDEAEAIVNKIMSKLPAVTAWIERVKYEARKNLGVRTLFNRFIPLPLINSDDKYERMHWERVAVNSVIQGSAAEIMKLGLIRLQEHGFCPFLTVHDEYLIEILTKSPDGFDPIKYSKDYITNILKNIVKLKVPLEVDVGVGNNWNEAKL